MTLNGHFALKSGSSSTSNGLAVGVLAFGENCTEICRAAHILPAAKMYNPGTVLVIKVLFIGVTEEEASKPVNCIHTLIVRTHAVH